MSEINAIRFAEPWQVSCVKIPMPEPKPGEALIKIMAAGICGSDIGAFRGTNGLVSYPRVIGHELAGVVVSIPENNKNGIKVGDRVVVDPYLYCGHCYPCSIGRTNCCDDLHVLGVHVEGGMAEYFCHPADMLVKIPDGMSWVQAAMAEPLTISLLLVENTNRDKNEIHSARCLRDVFPVHYSYRTYRFRPPNSPGLFLPRIEAS